MAFQKQLASRAGQREWSGFRFSEERAKEGTALAKAVEVNSSLTRLNLWSKWAFATRGRIRAQLAPSQAARSCWVLGGVVDGGV